MTASRTPATARIGSSEMNGFEGASSTRSAPEMAASTPGAGARRRRRSGSPRRVGSARRRTSQSWKGSAPWSVSITVRSRPSVAGMTVAGTPSRAATSATIADSGSPARRRARAHEVQADVAVAEDEPVGAAQLAHDAHRRAGVVADAPAQLADAAGQRVEHRVDVGRDVQIPVLEVVADVRDHGHGGRRLGREHAEREPRTADAAGEDGHPHAGSMPRMAITIDTSTPFGERAARRLREEPLAWLVTVSPAGQPQPSPVWFEWDASGILLYSKPDTPKLRNIAANPRVRCTWTATATAATS